MNLTNKNKFSNDTKKQLQSNFLSLIKENVMNEIPELKEDEYENIENSIIDSFDTETNNNEAGSIKDIEDVTLNDIVEINSNDDDDNEDIQDLTESQVFNKLYKYIMESQKTDDIKKEILKESKQQNKEIINKQKNNKINTETSNRRLKTKMSILDRKRRKYIKESLNKRNKKNLKESFEVVERYKEKYPDLFEGLKDKTLYDLYGNINKDIDGIIEQQYDYNLKKDEHIDFYDFIKMEKLDDEYTQYNLISNLELEDNLIENLRDFLSSNTLKEQDEEDESGIDELFDEEPKKDKEPKPDATGPKGKGMGPGEGKQDGTGLENKDQKEDKEPKKEKKDLKDSKEDELIKKVKELKPELKSKDVKVKMDKKLSGPVNGFTFEVVDDKNKSVSNFIVIDTGPKQEKKEMSPEDKVAGNVEESTLFESKRRKGKKILKEQDIDSVVQKVQQQVEEYLEGEKQKLTNAIDGAVNKNTSVQPSGEVDMSKDENIPDENGNQNESPEQTDNNNITDTTQNNNIEGNGNENLEKQEPKEEKSPEGEDESEDASLDDIFNGLEEEEQEESKKESDNSDDDVLFEGIFDDEDELFDDELEDESENDEDYLKESFFRLFDINPTKKQVQRKTSPRDYSPKGQNEETKKFIGTQEMKFPTENQKQKNKENKMEKAMNDLKEIF